MQRTRGFVVGALIGVAAFGAVAAASWQVDAHARAEGYDQALAASRRTLVDQAPDRAAVATTPVCVRGAEGLAVATAAARAKDVRNADGRLDPAALAALSRASFAAARDREDRTRAPALPQRMGLVDGAAVAMGAERCAGKPAFAAAVTTPAR